MQAVNEDNDVHDAFRSTELFQFSPKPEMRERLRELLRTRRKIIKEIGEIKNVKHGIAPKYDVEPVCEPMRRRSPKNEEVEKQAM